jgi:long-chain acyl-CoA synthetase
MADCAGPDTLPPSLSQMLTCTAVTHGDRPAITCGDGTLTYRELDALVTALAAGLLDLGVEPGDRVAFHLPNTPQFVVSYFAASRAGAVAVPINTLLADDEIAFMLQDSGAKVFITMDALAEQGVSGFHKAGGTSQLLVSGSKQPEGARAFEGLLVPPSAPVALPAAQPHDVAVIKYTSGTTGRPKGAMLTHHNLIFDSAACQQTIRVDSDDVFISVLPLFHCFGATVCMVLPVLLGAHSILLPRFTAGSCLGAIEAHRATVFAGVPSMFAIMLRASGEHEADLSSLRICVSGGAPITQELLSGFGERFHVNMLEGYGPTEASPVGP